jgi:hypothetical protein
MSDMVDHPDHYTSHPAGIEAIDVLRHATDYDLGQAMRYIWRVMWGGKWDNVEDIEKSIWYLQDWITKQKPSGVGHIVHKPYYHEEPFG